MDVFNDWWRLLLVLLEGQRVRVLAILAVFLVFWLVEYARPAEVGQGWRGRARNLLIAMQLLLLGYAALALWYVIAPPPKPEASVTSGWATLGMLLLYVALGDFWYYWYHRLQHSWTALWAVHELHHSDAELNLTTSLRTYWLEIPLQSALTYLPSAYLIGQDQEALALLPFVGTTMLLFTHCNVRLSLGRLTPVVTGPQLHRLHHSTRTEHRDSNFAQMIPLYDILFGTYRAPQKDEYPPTGVDELASDASMGQILMRPFQIWGRSIAALFGGGNSERPAPSLGRPGVRRRGRRSRSRARRRSDRRKAR